MEASYNFKPVKDEEEVKLQGESAEEQDEEKDPIQGDEVRPDKTQEVLTYLKEQGVEVESIEDLKKVAEPDDQALTNYLKEKYKYDGPLDLLFLSGEAKEFLSLPEDLSEIPEEQRIKRYLKSQNSALDDDDIDFIYKKQFVVDEEEMDEDEIREHRISVKKKLSEADKYLEEQRQKYLAPIESKDQPADAQSEEEKEAGGEPQKPNEAYLDFQEKTKALFSKGFKGFEFDLGKDNKVNFELGNIEETVNFNLDLNNLAMKFLDKETGRVSDLNGYHKSLVAAKDPDALAKFFYEKGKADAIKADAQKSDKTVGKSNIRKAVQKSTTQDGLTVRMVE